VKETPSLKFMQDYAAHLRRGIAELRDENAKLRAERDALAKEVSEYDGQWAAMADKIDALAIAVADAEVFAAEIDDDDKRYMNRDAEAALERFRNRNNTQEQRP
jgi:phage shock protein A